MKGVLGKGRYHHAGKDSLFLWPLLSEPCACSVLFSKQCPLYNLCPRVFSIYLVSAGSQILENDLAGPTNPPETCVIIVWTFTLKIIRFLIFVGFSSLTYFFATRFLSTHQFSSLFFSPPSALNTCRRHGTGYDIDQATFVSYL